MKDRCAPNAIFRWTVMVLDQQNVTNGMVYVKKQYICSECGKTHFTSLENFIKKYSNYTRAICEKSLEYESITYLYLSKEGRKIIKLEKWNRIKPPNSILSWINIRHVIHHTKRRKPTKNPKRNKKKSKLSGIYHYDEEFLHENGIKTVMISHHLML